MFRGIKLGAVALAVALPMTAAAEGWYASVHGGIASAKNKFDRTENVAIKGSVPTVRKIQFSDAKYKAGFRGGVAVGYKAGPVRVEGEFSHIRNKVKQFNITDMTKTGTIINGNKPVQFTDVSGDNRANAFMANLYYDFDDMGDFVPYVGVGVGAVNVHTKISGTAKNVPIAGVGNTTVTMQAAAKSTEIAGQAIAGARFAVSDNVAISADYRYLRTGKTASGTAFQSHSGNLGLTVFFG